MEYREKLKILFKINDRYCTLMNIIQMGRNGDIDLKITDYYNGIAIVVEQIENPDKGYLTESEMASAKFEKNIEMSYHKDGSFLSKINNGSNHIHDNPYGVGERWTPTDEIDDFQPVMNICIRRMGIYNVSHCTLPKLKSKESIYICENDDLFESNGSYYAILYIRKKDLPLSRYTSAQLYSDILISLNETYNLCLVFSRHSYPPSEPYYSQEFKRMITPPLNNSYHFCRKDTAKAEMLSKFDANVFNPSFCYFLELMGDGLFINLSEEVLQLIDQIDIIYESNKSTMPIKKPVFIKMSLYRLGDRLSFFNSLSQSKRQKLLLNWRQQLLY